MKKTEEFNLISFESTHMAIKSEKLLKEVDLDIRIIPVPREITSSCGLSLRINPTDYKRSREILDENKIEFSGCYIVKKIGLKKEILDITN
ncbi:DUF3343 domain-containing protein [Psychrilyobacter atlanticus]|uniref:DUF3343 domain-containing protein n=1 Tax=Psychrilyobacter atlanticus TaxID=271091 RepID=UPI000418D20A|nr:DUF3343 domain-containing protein [Psychrilyobacter atlanticus]